MSEREKIAKFVKEYVNKSSGKVRSWIPMRDTLAVSDQPCSRTLAWHTSTISGERLVAWIEMPLFLLVIDGIALMKYSEQSSGSFSVFEGALSGDCKLTSFYLKLGLPYGGTDNTF